MGVGRWGIRASYGFLYTFGGQGGRLAVRHVGPFQPCQPLPNHVSPAGDWDRIDARALKMAMVQPLTPEFAEGVFPRISVNASSLRSESWMAYMPNSLKNVESERVYALW